MGTVERPGPEGPDGASGSLKAWRRARARVAREHHPDLGGDLDTYLTAVAGVDARFGRRASRAAIVVSGSRGTPGVRATTGPLVTARRARARLWRRVRAAVRHGRHRLPRRVPGRRRYTTL